jgi:hypothetical protein
MSTQSEIRKSGKIVRSHGILVSDRNFELFQVFYRKEGWTNGEHTSILYETIRKLRMAA